MLETQLRSEIEAADRRRPGEIGAQAVGGAEARALADQHYDQPRTETLADLVAECDPGQAGDDDRRDAPVRQALDQPGGDRRGVAVDGRGGEAVGDDNGDVPVAGCEPPGALGGQPPPEIRAAQVRGAIASFAVHDQHRPGARAAAMPRGVEGSVDRVARQGVVALERQQRNRRQPCAMPPEGHARRGHRPQPGERIAHGA